LLTHPQDLSKLEALPQDLLNLVVNNLNSRDKAFVGSVNHFFRENLADALLKSVMFADYRSVSTFLFRQPNLIFQEVFIPMANGHKERMSILKYVLNNLDSHMWKGFLKALSEKDKQRFLSEAKELNPFIDLNPLFKAYKNYIASYQEWSPELKKGGNYWENSAYEKMHACWLEVGKEQAKLPKHFLKEMHLQNLEHWSTTNNFTLDPNESLYFMELPQLPPFPGLGTEFGIFRGSDFETQKSYTACVGRQAEEDLTVFRHLYEIRKNDIKQMINELSQSLQNNKVVGASK